MGCRLCVLVASVDCRRTDGIERLFAQSTEATEILVLTDNRRRTIGQKRNDLLAMAQGDYVCFVDDDDTVSDDYMASLPAGIATGADCITFDVAVSLNGSQPFPMTFSKDFPERRNLPGVWERWPNHLCPVKAELARTVGFPDWRVGEDADYAERLRPLLKTEHRIDRVLYHYDYSDAVTLTQRGMT